MSTINPAPSSAARSLPRALREPLLIGLLALTLNLAGNGAVGLWDRDEPRYAVCVREMRARNDWVFPTYNAEPRYHKPVLIYWLLLDPVLGLAILCSAIVLLSLAAAIVASVSVPAVWALSLVLIAIGVTAQVVGHAIFERRKASMADHPAHFLLGPPFVMAKLFIAFGFRRDLAAIIGPVPASYPGNR